MRKAVQEGDPASPPSLDHSLEEIRGLGFEIKLYGALLPHPSKGRRARDAKAWTLCQENLPSRPSRHLCAVGRGVQTLWPQVPLPIKWR